MLLMQYTKYMVVSMVCLMALRTVGAKYGAKCKPWPQVGLMRREDVNSKACFLKV